MELFGDGLAHGLAPLRAAVRILIQMVQAFFPLQLHDGATGDQFHVGHRAGKVQIFAAVHDGRAGGAHMNGLRAVAVEEVHRLLQLGA